MNRLATTFWLILGLLMSASHPANAAGNKFAILVGVNQYKHDQLPSLRVAEKDAAELAKVFEAQKYQVECLLGNAASRDAVQNKIRSVMKRFDSGDTVVIFFSGHGLQFEGKDDGYFCPVDAKPFVEHVDSMISLKWVYEQLESSFSGVKIVIVDACRNDPLAAKSVRAKGSGIDSGVNIIPPKGVAALFSCSAGQQSFEGDENGLFTQAMLECLRDGSNSGSNNRITWHQMLGYVKVRTEELAATIGKHQNPDERVIGLSGSPVLVALTPRTPIPMPANKKHENMTAISADPKVEAADQNLSSKSSGIEFVRIPAGSFLMGSVEAADEQPIHKVTISKDFLLGKYEVTQEQWQKVMGTAPWKRQNYVKEGPLFAATFVSWTDAIKFCNRLSELEQRPPFYTVTAKGVTISDLHSQSYRLPTEAEWEYACRAGSTTMYSFGNDAATLENVGWYWDNANHKLEQYAHEIGRKLPNKFGVFDMHGNVKELCWDEKEKYSIESSVDPIGPSRPTGYTYRVTRGGSWLSGAKVLRSSSRDSVVTWSGNYTTGFRVCRTMN